MKRLCIFCFYDAQGIVDESVELLLRELRENVQTLVTVVNGKVDPADEQKLHKYSDEVIKRRNVGFDAGAFKTALFEIGAKRIKEYDEFILCNDTFFGPIVPMREIFAKMSDAECDFWGLNYADWLFMGHLQSYFLVFRKPVIENEAFYQYWDENINENADEIEDVYAQFEKGLFFFLTDTLKLKYEVYAIKSECNLYLQPNYCLKKYHVPVLKKKMWKDWEENKDYIVDALQYVHEKTAYPIEVIVRYAARVYHLELTKEDILQYRIKPEQLEEKKYLGAEITANQMQDRIKASDGYYIYGSGIWARSIYWNLCRNDDNFRGFVVSNINVLKKREVYGYPVISFQELDAAKVDIVMGTNKVNTIEIIQENKDKMRGDRVISMFPDTVGRILQGNEGSY